MDDLCHTTLELCLLGVDVEQDVLNWQVQVTGAQLNGVAVSRREPTAAAQASFP